MFSRHYASIAFGSALALLAATNLNSAPVTGSCNPTAVKFSASTMSASTTSSAFKNIPEASISFMQGGMTPSCVIVRFTLTTYTEFAVDGLAVRAFMDGTTAAMPALLEVRGENDMFGYPRTLEFLFPSVDPGNHNVRMQFSNSKGHHSNIGDHVMIVHYIP